MGAIQEVFVPDIGDFKDVDVIEVLVKPGDAIAREQSLISVESDKATMEIPSPADGVVRELKIKIGDKVSEGTLILLLEAGASTAAAAPASAVKPAAPSASAPAPALRRRRPRRIRHARRLSQWNPPLRAVSSRTRARRCGSSRASSASISPR
jgi:pyruvate/2-oxoglutarate dehydrogenase complex dihydrolipoamide acyltransferase (E2) component